MIKAQAPIKPQLKITQPFGVNAADYKKFGMKGHNGVDLRSATGNPLYLMLPGVLKLQTEMDAKGKYYGYGCSWILSFGLANKRAIEFTFAHLQNRKKAQYDGKNVSLGASPIKIAETDNTGYSTAAHLHITQKYVSYASGRRVVENYGNGFYGAVDPAPFLTKQLGFILL